jgi:hypothetical protein
MTHRLLYALVAMLLLGKLVPVSACSMANPPTDAQLFEKASTVFIGHIVRTEEIESRYPEAGVVGPAVQGRFRLVEVRKGEPPADRKVVGPIPVMCMMPLMVGLDYVIFLNEGSNFIVWAMDRGTRPLPYEQPANAAGAEAPRVDRHCQHRECILQRLRDLSKKAQ